MYYEEPFLAAMVSQLDIIAICAIVLTACFVLGFFSLLIKWIFDGKDYD